MEKDLFIISPAQLPTQIAYVKTAVVIIILMVLIYAGAQWRSPPLVNAKISAAVSILFGVLLLYRLTRSSYTSSLGIDYENRKIFINYITVNRSNNTLDISFDELNIKIDTSFGVKGYGSKWQLNLMKGHNEVYSILSDEKGFSEAALNAFLQRVKRCIQNK